MREVLEPPSQRKVIGARHIFCLSWQACPSPHERTEGRRELVGRHPTPQSGEGPRRTAGPKIGLEPVQRHSLGRAEADCEHDPRLGLGPAEAGDRLGPDKPAPGKTELGTENASS